MDQNRDGFIDKNDLRDTFAALGKLMESCVWLCIPLLCLYTNVYEVYVQMSAHANVCICHKINSFKAKVTHIVIWWGRKAFLQFVFYFVLVNQSMNFFSSSILLHKMQLKVLFADI